MSQDFLVNFQEKMDKLTNIRRNIQSGIQFKEQFTNDLKAKLGEINQRLQELATLISNLKSKADNLETQIGTNTTSISDKERELQQLKDQITALNSEKENLIAKITQQESASKNQMDQQQAKIDAYEAELRDVKQKFDAQTSEINALREEMTKTGNDKDITHAENLKQLTEQSEKSLQEQEAQLMQKINDCESKIAGYEQQIKDKDTELEEKQKAIDEATGQAQTSAQGLQQQIDSLKAENEQLVQRLIAATEAISQAADDLQTLTDSAPNVQTKQDIDDLLNQITQQIEQSIQNIGRAAQGQTPVQRMNIQPATNITLQDISSGNDVSLPFGSFIKMIANKASQIKNGPNKYKDALDKLKTINDPSQIENILNANNIAFKNNQIMGGRKTKKNRKQKGGFTYKSSIKRRSISSSNSRKSSRKSSRRSSR